MDPVMLPNLVDPAILFFFLGLLVAGVRSDLHVPEPVVKFLSLYLLVAIGFKGGRALSTGGFDGDLVRVVAVAMLLAVVMPAIGFAVLRRRVPLFAHASGLNAGDAVLLSVLAPSASYIVVPAVVRSAIPEARPSRYFGLALGVTFPFNIVVGIPLYHAVVMRLW